MAQWRFDGLLANESHPDLTSIPVDRDSFGFESHRSTLRTRFTGQRFSSTCTRHIRHCATHSGGERSRFHPVFFRWLNSWD